MNSNGKRYLHYPEQKMKPHSKADLEEGQQQQQQPPNESDEELMELTNRDPFVQGLLMKKAGPVKDDDDR
jgi:hypothetical protein